MIDQPTAAARIGGRPAVIDVNQIRTAGRALGMHRLSLNAVAAELGVSSTALYRHIDGRWELERLVGESLLTELVLRDEPTEDIERHLVSFGGQLRAFVLAHPGMGSYLQALFPRGEAGARLLATEVAALHRRGYAPDAAVVLCGAVASLTIAIAAAEERAAAAAQTPGYPREVEAVERMLAGDATLGPAHAALPTVTTQMYARLLLAAAVGGLVAVAPPGRPVAQIVAELAARGGIDGAPTAGGVA